MSHRVVAGRHSVTEALKVRPHAIKEVFIDERFEAKKWADEIKGLAKKNKIPMVKRKDAFFEKLCQISQGVSCEVLEDPAWPDEAQENLFILALDGVEDPQNFGAIIRTAWLMGVDGILTPLKESVGLTPTVTKIASGGTEHVPIMKVKNLKNEISDLKDQGFWSYALAVDESSESLKSVRKSKKTIMIAGAEEKGIRPTLLKSSDFKVYIPQSDPEASFNVSVSVALGIWSLIEKS